jgi:hypothetical protein
MNRNNIISFLFLIFELAGCTISGKQVAGNFIDVKHGDSLQILNDSSYIYLEKLNSGVVGETQGKWKNKKHRIVFICDHKPLVGYRLKVNRDSTSHNFRIKLLLEATSTPIHIEKVGVFKNGNALSQNNFEQSKNMVRIFSKSFDSIIIQTFNFTNIKFRDTLNKNYGYIARIYPVERLYELDKVPFKIKKKTLKSAKTDEYKDIFLTFKKIRK